MAAEEYLIQHLLEMGGTGSGLLAALVCWKLWEAKAKKNGKDPVTRIEAALGSVKGSLDGVAHEAAKDRSLLHQNLEVTRTLAERQRDHGEQLSTIDHTVTRIEAKQ